jgi:ActR/RegA family two-component response regulator
MNQPRVLLVAPDGGIVRGLAPSLRAAGYVPKVVVDFASAKEALAARPDLLITELKLGAYNGLHLAIRAAVQGTPTIVVGDPDAVLESEARRQHATYLATPVTPERVLALMSDLLAAAQHVRRSPRKHVPLLDAFANEVPARVLDVSYEGMRLETPEAGVEHLPAYFKVHLPLFNFSCDVQRVWVSSISQEQGERAFSGVSCGAELSTGDTDTVLAWRTLVDSMPGLEVTA